MKKILIAVSMLLGISGMSFAQTSVAKTTTNKPAGKMTITKTQAPSKSLTGATQAAATTPKPASTVKSSNRATPGKEKNKTIGKHPKKNKQAKKAQKAEKKTTKNKVGKKE